MIVADTPGFAKDARLRFVLHAAPDWAALRDMLALGQVDAAPMPARCRSPPFGVDAGAGVVGASGHLILPRDQFLDARIFDPKATAGPKMRRMNAADAKNPARQLTLRCGIDSLSASAKGNDARMRRPRSRETPSNAARSEATFGRRILRLHAFQRPFSRAIRETDMTRQRCSILMPTATAPPAAISKA